MQKLPFEPGLQAPSAGSTPAERSAALATETAATALLTEATDSVVTCGNWRQGLPVLKTSRVTLRDLAIDDAPTLLTMMSSQEVGRFISPPPATIAGFERFINWTLRGRENGRHLCFGIVPPGMTSAVGLFQVRSLESGFSTAEWGFALGSDFWGSGMFGDGAQLVLDFAFEVIGVHRLEARASTFNGRGNAALRKLGAVEEGRLRRSFLRDGQYHDQVLWAILAEDWRDRRAQRRPSVH